MKVSLNMYWVYLRSWFINFQVHPEDIRDAEEAKAVLLAPPDVACGFSMNECNDLKDRIISSIR